MFNGKVSVASPGSVVSGAALSELQARLEGWDSWIGLGGWAENRDLKSWLVNQPPQCTTLRYSRPYDQGLLTVGFP